MKTCPKCNRIYQDEEKFCSLEGTLLITVPQTMKTCPQCGRSYPAEASFCMIDAAPLVVEAGLSEPAPMTPPAVAQPTRKTKKRAVIKKTRKSKAPAALDPRDLFNKGMARWLQQMEYSVELSQQKVDTEKDLKFAEKTGEVLKTILNVGTSMWITSGQGSAELFQALIPYLPLSDLLGSKLDLQVAQVIPVIYADGMTPQAIEERFDQLIELAGPLTQFGPRLNFQSQGVANIFPLLVYFDRQKFADHLPELLPDAWQKRIMRRIYLMAGLVNVPDRTVTWPEKKGFFGLGDKLADIMGSKKRIFEDSDVAAVMQLANQE